MRPFVAFGAPSQNVLLRATGHQPLGPVFGVSVVSMGSATLGTALDGAETVSYTDCVRTALGNALRRLREQASERGAQGVVGVRLEMPSRRDQGFVEVRCLGTAIAQEARSSREIFLTNLDAAALVALEGAGHQALGLAVGYCFYRQAESYRTTSVRQATLNGLGFATKPYEHPDFTKGVYEARRIAMERLHADALALGAEGVVGVELRDDVRTVTSMMVDLVVVDTGVRRRPGTYAVPAKPAIVVSVRDSEEP